MQQAAAQQKQQTAMQQRSGSGPAAAAAVLQPRARCDPVRPPGAAPGRGAARRAGGVSHPGEGRRESNFSEMLRFSAQLTSSLRKKNQTATLFLFCEFSR